jgi:signal transduction histidine kinase
METLKRGDRIEHYVTKRRRKDGQQISISLSISPISDVSGNIVGVSSIARNITDQIHAEEEINRLNRELEMRVETRSNDLEAKRSELEESQLALMNIVEDLNLKTTELEDANSKLLELDRLKSMFIASMSHELRTPLNSIIGFSSIIRDGWLGQVNPEQKENLGTIQRAGKHLLSLINDVIDVSKIEAGRIEARFEEFDLYELLAEAVQYVEKDINEKGMELTLQLQHQLLRTDKRRLLQCIINLLSNAVKFTEHGGITVSSTKADVGPDVNGEVTTPNGRPTVSITISDTGIGIAAEDIPTIFEPFVRLESHMKTVAPGTGLGLYLTRKLVVEVLGGDILCTSTIGMGSTFTLTIPERIYEKGTGGRG